MSGKPVPVGVNDIGDVGLTSPLDANGNLNVDLQTPIPAGSNVIGTVGVTSLPALPAGTNTIGGVNIASPLPFASAVNLSTVSTTLSTANTAQALPSGTAYNFITIYNKNSDTITVGNSSTQNIPITSNGSYSIDVHLAPINLASIYWVSATTGDYIEVMYA